MAAPAPSPYRSSPPSSIPSNAGPSSSSSAHPASSKKQQDVAAGRRRWEAFKNEKKAGKQRKTPAGPTNNESSPNAPEDEQQRVAGSVSVPPSTSAVSNGHVSKDNHQDGADTSSREVFTTAEVAKVPMFDSLENLPSSNAEARLREAEQDFDSKVPSSNYDLDTIRGSHIHGTDQPSIGSTGRPFGRTESVPSFQASMPTSSANNYTYSRNGFGKPTAPLGGSGPLILPASTPPLVPQHLEAPISVGNFGKVDTAQTPPLVRPSPFTLPFPASQAFQNNPLPATQRPGGGSLVKLDNKLFSNTARIEDHPPSSMEPEQELVSSARPSGFQASVPASEWMRPDRQTDGNASNAGITAIFPRNNESWRMPESETEKVPISAVNRWFSTVPPPISTSSNFVPVPLPHSDAPDPKYLPFHIPPKSYPSPTYSVPRKSEPSLPPSLLSMNDSSDTRTSSNASIQPPLFSTSGFDSAPVLSDELSASSFIKNGIVEPKTSPYRPNSRSTAALESPTQTKKVAEPVDQNWQLPPTKSAVDDFSMLEQHIEDLTQEKFSLQRGLDAARALADTLVQENSALAEDYNKQGALVNELKDETERQNGEMRAQAVVVKNLKSERDKAIQESKAAVGRAQALAAEVIALEEKVLRSRSQELKLHREMESLSADTESQKRQITSLEKDRANLRSLVEALQEEKSLLQARLRKAVNVEDGRLATSDVPLPSAASAIRKSDVSTSTEDLELEAFLTAGTAVLLPSSQLSLENSQPAGFPSLDQQHGQPAIMPSVQITPLLSPSHVGQSSESSSTHITARASLIQSSTGPTGASLGGRSLHLGSGSASIPHDQVVIVENINNLISELAEEKEALLKALRAESVGASELRALNAELSQKLEVQTQRLELAVAQSMAHGSTPTIENAYETSRLGPVYVDEGDEVVDRVLGWIMQLFPSGSSRRKRL
ncbi:hypothetical protein MPTK1_7g09100 [Marchantia polymorpha subsp. ruderalis]|uniref:Uncharacterized protein n=2 Tax=Marchantia polymorpha TaxID=3197 RepID=A0AAF6BXN2_MARPO|nr:hypothetical protein MARPO_0068s0063 [Marchantia polymorpha]BBN16766.1 hypothetical protein Mp_7g09100 [Marchantia polymorpha subsp. ruderalis]|eukprot:PTQ35849.1 hypothetical protein MARPO_0068s0063 [Marchantia polymorpha]